MNSKRENILKLCEEKLLDIKFRYTFALASKTEIPESEKELADIANARTQASDSLLIKNRMKSILPEIEYALFKIKNRTYGTCEVTGEEIEEKRLLAVPWTRLSMKAHLLDAS